MASRGETRNVSTPTAEELRANAAAYEQRMPLASVEETMLETTGDAVAAGELRWRDVEWMVRWYYRRHLSSRYNDPREKAEAAFRNNEWPAVEHAIEQAISLDAPGERIAALAQLDGIDVGIASSILYFTGPDRDIVLGEPEWATLERWGVIDGGLSADVTPSSYRRFRDVSTDIARTRQIDLVTLQRALFIEDVSGMVIETEGNTYSPGTGGDG